MIAKKMIEEQWQTTINKKSITATFANFIHLKLFQKPKEKKLQLSLPEARRKASLSQKYWKILIFFPTKSQNRALLQSRPIKNSIRSPAEFLINFTGPT